ncbi:Ubiquinol cytochrome-c reductase assembly protein Cbp3, partial [Spiromyces aspiralis]
LHEEGERKQQQKIVSDKIVGDKASLVLPGFWLKDANLPSTFQTWFSVQALYIWMLMVRLRAIPHYKHYSQELVDNWFLDAEARIKAAGIRSSKVVNDTLKDLVSSFRGAVLAYDEGLVKGDAVLASAVWRNLLGTTDDDVLPEVMLDVLVFIRKQLTMLNQVTDQDFILGNFKFDEIVSSTKGDGVSQTTDSDGVRL